MNVVGDRESQKSAEEEKEALKFVLLAKVSVQNFTYNCSTYTICRSHTHTHTHTHKVP